MIRAVTNLVIFGAGSIGSVTAAYLDRAGMPITVIDPWYVNVETIRGQGLQVERTGEAFVAHPHMLHIDETDRLDVPIDVLVIAMKSYDTEWVARFMEPYLAPDAIVISAQNCVDNEGRIAAVIGRERVIGCAVPMSAYLDGPGHLIGFTPRASGAFVLGELDGPVSDRVRRMAELLAPVGAVRTVDDIGAATWAKYLLNLTTNALGGLTRWTTPQLWEDRRMLALMVTIGGEAVHLARRLGQRIADITPPGLPPEMRYAPELLAEAHDGDADAFERLVRIYGTLAAGRRGMTPGKVSLLQDLLRGRRTEVDHLNGWVAVQGRAHGLNCPMNAAVTTLVHDLELGRIEPGPETVLRALSPAFSLSV